MSFFGDYIGTTGGTGIDSNPVVTVVSPTPGVAPGDPGGFPADAAAAAATPIVIDITDATPGAQLVLVSAHFIGSDVEEVVYRRGAFRGNYIAGSSQTLITDGWRLSCKRNGGWPGPPVFSVDVVDADGNLAS